MRTADVQLAAKEIGYFASRLLVSAHCPPGAVPELSRIAYSQDLVTGRALEELIDAVDSQRGSFSDLAIELIDSEYRTVQPLVPPFAALTYIADVVIAETNRHGQARAELRNSGSSMLWLEGVVSTRYAPKITLVIASGQEAVLNCNGTTYTTSDVGRALSVVKEKPAKSAGNITLAAAECDAELSLDEDDAFVQIADPAQRQQEIFDKGRPMTSASWKRLAKVVSRTLVASSEKSRMGAG